MRYTHLEAALTLNIHEERVGALHQPLSFMLLLLELSWRVQQIDVCGEDLHIA